MIKRFEISAVVFLVFNALFAFLSLREQRSLLFYCQDWSRHMGDGSDCLEPYNFLWLGMLVLVWIVGALALGAVAVIFYVNAKRELRAAQVV